MANHLPSIGAALFVANLPAYRDWLIDGRRDIEIQDPILPELLDGDWRTVAARARDLLVGHSGRLGIHGPFIDLTIAAYDPRMRALVIERLRQGLEFAGALGATHMVIHSPFMSFGHGTVTFSPALYRSAHIELSHATLEPLLPLAEQIGCVLVIENIADASPAPLLDLVRSFDTPFVQASLDTGHAAIMRGAGAPPPDQWVREAGALLAHVHLQDNDGYADRHWAPGDGELGWYAIFEALGELEQRPRLLLELKDAAQIRRGADYLVGRGLAV